MIYTDTQPRRSLGLSRREVERFSFARAILASAHGRLKTDAPFELEVSQAEAKSRGLAEPMGTASFYLPSEILTRAAMTAGDAFGSPLLIGTDNAPRDIVGETLRAQAVIGRLGVQVESNMMGDVSIPVVTTPPTPVWLSIDGVSQITPTQPTIAQRSATPKTVAASTTCSHQLLTTAPGLAERLALGELTKSIATAVDTAFLAGSGVNGEPQGIVGASGVGSVTGTSIAYAGLLEFQADVLTAAALAAPQSFGYVTTTTIAKLLASRQRFTGSDSPLWQGSLIEGTVAGARAVATSSAPASTIIAGDFANAIVLMWPGLLLAADPYTGFRTGVVTLRAMLSVDFVFLRPAGFSVAGSVT